MKPNPLARLLRDNPTRAPVRALRVVNDDAALAHVYLYDVIDSYFGIGAQEFADTLNAITAPTIHLHINSPGGDVFDARAMATAIKEHPSNILARVDGLAASAASTVAMAADEVHMAAGSFLMIHRAWTLAFGNAEDFMDTAALLEKIDGAIAADYAAKSGKPLAEVVQLMADETWFTAQEALDAGLADTIDEGDDAGTANALAQARTWNVTAYGKAPRALTDPPEPNHNDGEAMRATALRRLQLIEAVQH